MVLTKHEKRSSFLLHLQNSQLFTPKCESKQAWISRFPQKISLFLYIYGCFVLFWAVFSCSLSLGPFQSFMPVKATDFGQTFGQKSIFRFIRTRTLLFSQCGCTHVRPWTRCWPCVTQYKTTKHGNHVCKLTPPARTVFCRHPPKEPFNWLDLFFQQCFLGQRARNVPCFSCPFLFVAAWQPSFLLLAVLFPVNLRTACMRRKLKRLIKKQWCVSTSTKAWKRIYRCHLKYDQF